MRNREIAPESLPSWEELSMLRFLRNTSRAVSLATAEKTLSASKGSRGLPLSFHLSLKNLRAPSSLKIQDGRLKARPLRGAVETKVRRTGEWSEHLEERVPVLFLRSLA